MAQLSLLGDTQRPDFPKRASNRVKYDIVVERLEARGRNLLKMEFPDAMPTEAFRLTGRTIEQLSIRSFSWSWRVAMRDAGIKGWYVNSNSRPTNEEVEGVIQFFESLPELNPKHIYFEFRCESHWLSREDHQILKIPYGSTFSHQDLINGKVSLTIEPLWEKLDAAIDAATLKDGNFWCGYCGKQFPLDQKVTHTIIGRGRKEVWNSWKGRMEDKACVTSTPMEFCSGTCAGNEQMSREG